MPVKDSQTEEHIKQTAKDIFFAEGNLHATTQEIADKAGVNRALIHYYFRSRELLFERVFREAMGEMFDRLRTLFISEKPFQQRMEEFLDVSIDESSKYPFLESFVVAEINRSAEPHVKQFPTEVRDQMLQKFLAEIEAEIDKGTLPPVDARHFIVNMMSLTTYPLLAKPIIQMLFSFDEAGYQQFLKEQKKQIIQLVFRGK